MPPTPPKRPSRAAYDTPLSYQRIRQGVTQEELATAVGVSVRTIRRLEAGEMTQPSIRLLMNCAFALGERLQMICQPEWLEWTVFTEGVDAPPDPETFLKPGRLTFPKRADVDPDNW